MATGAYDSNGIWQYGEDDPLYPFSGYLNRLAASTSDAIGALKTATAGLGDTGWSDVTLVAPWTSYDNGVTFQKPQYRKTNGVVRLQGSMKGGTTGVTGTAFTLPVGSRPAKILDFIVSVNAGMAQLRVNPSGAVQVLGYYSGGTAVIVSLAGVTFPAEA